MATPDQIVDALSDRRVRGMLQPNDPFLKGETTPLELSTFRRAESLLGYQLPNLLRRIYTEVANGGFGESYGFLGLLGGPVNEDGMDGVSLYLANRTPDPTDAFWVWPDALLPIVHLGCGMYQCIKCDAPNAPIIWFEPNPHETGQSWHDAFFPFCPSLNDYLSAWIEGRNLWDDIIE